MSKILKNTTASPISISDTGVTIAASPASYTIPPQDYLLWASSSDVVAPVGTGSILVNDGSFDLSPSDGMDLIKGLFPATVDVNQNSSPWITNDPDVEAILSSIAVSLGASTVGVWKYQMLAVSSKNETDMPSTTYTVPVGKKFSINNFTAAYDLQFTMLVRLKKQTGGAGAWDTLATIALEVGGQGQSTVTIPFGNGVIIGQAGDVFKLTYEGTNARGNVRAFFTGNEI